MKTCLSRNLVVALTTIVVPFCSGQSLAPSATDTSFDSSLTPSSALPLESLVPSATESSFPDSSGPSPSPVDFGSLAPSIVTDVESLVPSSEVSLDNSLVPTIESITVDSQVPTFTETSTDSQAPTITETSIDSQAPTVLTIDTTQPTEPLLPLFPGVEPQCTAHTECLMVGMDGLCCPTAQNIYLSCCDLGDTVTITPPENPVTADPLENPDDSTGTAVQLSPTGVSLGCMKVKGSGQDDDEVMIATCDGSDPMQKFKLVDGQIQLADSNMCLQAGRQGETSHGKYMRVFKCDSSNELQEFTWEAPNGRLYPTNYPGFTVVYQGTTAHINSDRIIVADLTVPGVVEREGWETL